MLLICNIKFIKIYQQSHFFNPFQEHQKPSTFFQKVFEYYLNTMMIRIYY